MRVVCRAVIVILAACLLLSTSTVQRLPVGPIPIDCNRACLEGLINQYLGALLAHDPKPLPLSADVKYTEQEQIMEIGDGFWKSVTGPAGESRDARATLPRPCCAKHSAAGVALGFRGQLSSFRSSPRSSTSSQYERLS